MLQQALAAVPFHRNARIGGLVSTLPSNHSFGGISGQVCLVCEAGRPCQQKRAACHHAKKLSKYAARRTDFNPW